MEVIRRLHNFQVRYRRCFDGVTSTSKMQSNTTFDVYIAKRCFYIACLKNYMFRPLYGWSSRFSLSYYIVNYTISSSSSPVICQTTGPKTLPKRFLHIVRSRASSFNWQQYPLVSLRSSSSFLCLLPCLLVTSICSFIFSSITCCRRQFLRKIWPIQLAFLFLISCRIFLCSLGLSNTSSFLTWSIQLIFSILLQHHKTIQ